MPPELPPDPLPGVNLWGYLQTESGVGEHARTLLAALDEARVPVAPIDFPDSRSRRGHPLPPGARDEPCFDLHLICVNADQTPHFVAKVGPESLVGHRIGYWHWEVEEFPDWMAKSAELVDEIWTASRHSALAIRRKVTKPVHVVLPAVDPPAPAPPPPDLLPPGAGPLFLTCFDFDSVIERKNPEGAMAAFRLAFPAGGARLLVKSVNGHLHLERLAALIAAAADRPDIHVVDRYLERAEQAGLIAACDVFVSLHRAEGFGLMLAEAMWFGRPVVATAYSGNLEFMDESLGRLVPWRPAQIPAGAGPYTGIWAEPDLDAAAEALRELGDSTGRRRTLGSAGRESLLLRHGVAARGAELAGRLRACAVPHPSFPEARRLEDLRARFAAGPDPGGAAVLGAFGRLLRRLALRVQRHLWLHQRSLDGELLDWMAAERAERLDAERRLAVEIRGSEFRTLGELRRLERRLWRAGAPTGPTPEAPPPSGWGRRDRARSQ